MSSTATLDSLIKIIPKSNPVNLGTQQVFMYPDHPEYATEAVRSSSFTGWPCSRKQKPHQLSEAGFFYTGIGDRVKCFCCGGGLKDWDENDYLREQHALWLDKCHYLKLMKGVNYIQAAAEKFKTVKKESKNIASTEVNESEESEESISSMLPIGSPLNCLPNTKQSVKLGTQPTSMYPNHPEYVTEAVRSSSFTNNDLNIYRALITGTIEKRIEDDDAESSTSSCSDEENWDNLSTNSQSSEEAEEASSEQDAIENEAAYSVEKNCDNLSTSSQSIEGAESFCKRTKLYSHRLHISKDFEESKKSIAIYEASLCKICYVVQYETAFSPCGHVVACAKCASSVEKCPICRNQFKEVVRLYFS